MNIIFDLDQLEPKWNKQLSFDEMVAIDDIYEYVETRVKVLKNEIELEESEKPNDCFIIIALTKDKIMFMGYSDELTEKLKNCFNEKDIAYLKIKINETSKNFLN